MEAIVKKYLSKSLFPRDFHLKEIGFFYTKYLINMEREFKGIWIPKEIWLSKDLTVMEKLLLVEISSLDNKEGCFAGNAYFADFFNLSKTRISLIIKALITKGYITSTIIFKEGTQQILKRVLNICYRGYITKVKEGTQHMLKDNNTVNNTISNIVNKDKRVEQYFADYLLDNLFKEFLELRISLRAKNTGRAVKLILKKLEGLTPEVQTAMLEQSIENSWKSVFPLKKQFNDKNEPVSLAKKYFPEMFGEKPTEIKALDMNKVFETKN